MQHALPGGTELGSGEVPSGWQAAARAGELGPPSTRTLA